MSSKQNSELEISQEKVQVAINNTNKKIEELGEQTGSLYKELSTIQESFDLIRNVPTEKRLQYEKVKKVRLNWKQQAAKIEKDYKNAVGKEVGAGAAGAGVGIAVVAMGPTAAMGVATTFGVASTGTAISTLSGAAATNAALAWLGGGALAAGGGGIAAGEVFLALAGPIGWGIAIASICTSGVLFWKSKSDKRRTEEIFTLISERDITSYKLAIVELNERINRIKDESKKINAAINTIRTFGIDYDKMTEAQQYELGAYVNLMEASTQLLINPIKGLQPKYTDLDFNVFMKWRKVNEPSCAVDFNVKKVIISLANLLYKINLSDKDKKLMCKNFKNNKKLLKSMNVTKKEFVEGFEVLQDALKYKYMSESK